ncbi:M28 family metallopeptidase [Acidobacteriia bacterium AH_259_A11_L15]|nr:M28 family metallopeptidase [Acidobacteriia bacterium AH_259_A11_L15]
MEELPKDLVEVHARWAPVEQRVEEILQSIRRACADRLPGESDNRANERLVEEFIAWLRTEFPERTYEVERDASAEAAKVFAEHCQQARQRQDKPCVVIERQRLSRWALRTTRWNFVFTVPGESAEVFLLVAHYDTWRGPGADDNTTGEEILKQYLLADLRAEKRPRLTHTYFLAGSEECGLVGLLSQLLLAAGLIAGMRALQQEPPNWALLAVALALCPLASYRIGVSGSREYVRALRAEELQRIRAVVSVDSVGEGRMFIPRSTLGADFIRALIPFGDYDAFTDVLEEGAHLHGVKYNNYIAGGTTDHVSFLEVNNGLWARTREWGRRAWARVTGKEYRAPFQIPASALVAMVAGKASPIVFGGKIHTENDVPERVYAKPLREALLILDYVFYILEGGKRGLEPRRLDEFHYARLYEISHPDGGASEYWLGLKDAIEPNRRNLNAVYRVQAQVDEAKKEAAVHLREPLGWGVDTRMREDVEELCAAQGKEPTRVRLDQLTVSDEKRSYTYARRLTFTDRLYRGGLRVLAWLERQMGRHSFIAFFVLAYGIAKVVSAAMNLAFAYSFAFQSWFFRYQVVTIPLLLVFQIGLLVYLMARRIPTWIDNNYRHENRADNMSSLRRVD